MSGIWPTALAALCLFGAWMLACLSTERVQDALEHRAAVPRLRALSLLLAALGLTVSIAYDGPALGILSWAALVCALGLVATAVTTWGMRLMRCLMCALAALGLANRRS